MIYQLVATDKFDKVFKKLDKQIQKIIKAQIEKNLIDCESPRLHEKGLTANRSGEWIYRVCSYRILVEIQDNEIVLVLVYVGHRKSIY